MDSNKKILFATSNQDKVREVREMLEPLGFQVICLKDVGLEVTHPEDAETFVGNAKIKAEDIASKCDYPVISDDSGLAIHCLNGFPGVHSARFMEGQSYDRKNEALLDMIKDSPDRTAAYITAMVYLDKKKGIEEVFEGTNEGELTLTVDYEAPNGFGYDPIFYSYDLKQTFGRATAQDKDRVSHRGKAIQKMVAFLKTLKD